MKRKLLLLFAFLAVIALAGFWATPRSSEATSFNPFFGPSDFYRLDPPTPGAASDVHAQFNVFPNSANFSGLFGRAITLGDSDVNVASAAAIPNTGAYIGELDSVATLGTLNEGCNGTVPVTFNFVEASVDGGGPNSTAARAFTNPAGGMTVGVGGIPAAAAGTDTNWTYATAGGVDPLGLKQNTDGVAGYEGSPGLGGPAPGPTQEGNVLVGVNEIRVDSEEMLVTGVDYATNQYRVKRGWNGTATAAHAAAATVLRVPVIYPNGPPSNLLANLGEDDGDLDNNGVAEEAAGPPGGPQFNGNQVADGADALPSFVRNSLDPNVNAQDGGYVQLHTRYAGVAFVASSLIVILQFAIMGPGQAGGDSAQLVTSFTATTVGPVPGRNWSPNQWAGRAVTVDGQARTIVSNTNNTFTTSAAFVDNPPAGSVDFAIPGVFPNLEWMTNAWGYASVTFLQDPLAPPSDSAINDFCNFSSNTFFFGTTHDNLCTGASPPVACTGTGAGFTLRLAVDGGCPGTTTPNECGSVRQQNPATAQRVRYYQYAVSQRDYDNDGHENALDTCPYHYNPGWDPRKSNALSGGDTDGDGLPDPCDPTPVGANPDQDGDGGGTGWFNRLDNCPSVPNVAPVMAQPNALQFDYDNPDGVPVYDGGPNSDSIGPECDIAANTCTTAAPFNCPVNMPTLVPNGANGHYHATYAAQTICIGAATTECAGDADCVAANIQGTCDADLDGVVNGHDTCIGGSNPPTGSSVAGDGQTTTTVAVVAPGATTLTVGNTNGFHNGQPIMIGSVAPGPLETLRYINAPPGATTISFTPALNFAHASGTDVREVRFAQSIRDVNNNGTVGVIDDITYLTGRFNTQGGDPTASNIGIPPNGNYVARVDVNNDHFIDVIGDISKFTGVFSASCGPP